MGRLAKDAYDGRRTGTETRQVRIWPIDVCAEAWLHVSRDQLPRSQHLSADQLRQTFRSMNPLRAQEIRQAYYDACAGLQNLVTALEVADSEYATPEIDELLSEHLLAAQALQIMGKSQFGTGMSGARSTIRLPYHDAPRPTFSFAAVSDLLNSAKLFASCP